MKLLGVGEGAMCVHLVDICGGGVQDLGQIKQGELLFHLHFISIFVTNTKSVYNKCN